MLTTRNHHEGSAERLVPTSPSELASVLGSADGVERQLARENLVDLGKAAVPALAECLHDPRKLVRWEAAKTLVKIADPAAAGPLVAALEDQDGDVRWVAAVALIALGRGALRPLLVALIENPESDYLLRGGHHVCHELARTGAYPIVKPVLDAIGGAEPRTAVPPAAYKALHSL